jgi:UDP-glucuronate decarboxylase
MARSLLLSTTPIRRSGLNRRNGVPDTSNSSSTFFSKQTLLVLGVGILFGYILLPVLMIEMNVEEAMEALPSVSIKYPGLQDQVQPKGSSVALRKTASAYDVPPPRSLEVDGKITKGLNEAQKRLVEDHDVLSTHSLPTSTTPYVMKTAKLPDHQRMKILVTGGAGFVGSHLVDKLMMEGHEVIVLDNFFTGQKKNVAHWLHHPNFSLITHDVTEPITLEVDQIYHLACPASPPHYQYNPVKTIKTSTQGTLNMLGLAKRVRARILLTSTSEIYGDPQVHPQPESYWGNVNTIGPRSCYDEGKRVAETMMYSYKNQNGVEIRIARIFNTFGPRMHPNDGRVVSNFIIQALQNKDLTIYGEGQQTRSFQYVTDLVDGLHALMNGDYDSPVNLGNPEEYSIKDFAEYISKLTNTKSKIVKLAKSQDDPGQRRPDISTAKRELNWEPKVKVEKGLENTIAYFRKVLSEAGEIIPTGPGAAKPEA